MGEARSIRPLCGLFTCLYGFFHLLELPSYEFCYTNLTNVCSLACTDIISHTFALALVYPFSLGFTVAFAAFPNKISLAAAAALAVSTFLYSGFGVFWAELYGINDQAYRFKRGYSCF